MKLKVSVLVALLPAALALPSPSPSNAGDIDLSDLADLPAPSEVPVDVVSSSVNLVAIATSLAAEQSITFQASVPTATPLRKRQTSSCQAFSKYASANPDVTNTVQGFQSYFTDASSSLDGYGLPIYTGVNSAGPKNGLLSINTYTTYDPSVCKAKCDGMGNCQSFAIWRERVPQQKYDANACPIPSADAAYQTKCLYYSYPLQTSDGSNKGQWTNNGKFYVAQTSVKFFNKTPYAPPTISKFNSPVGGYGTCAPAVSDADKDKVLTASGTYYAEALARDPGAMSTVIDPSFCASQCQSITKAGAADPTSGIKLNCNMFSLFLLRSNGKDFWQCQYFTKDLDASHNTKCASGAVVASWKYVLTNPAPSYVNTNPPTTPPTCTGSDSSTFGVRCIEDLNNIEGRSDVNVQYTINSAPGESHYYHKTAKLIGFEDPSGNEYYIHDTQFPQNDATYLSTDKTFGLIYNDSPNTYTLKASGFVFDLESIDLAGWFLTIYQRGATMTLYGMRDGAIVTQASPALQIPSAAGQPFAHATGLLDLGFKKIDSLRIVTSIDNYGLFAFDNLVLTRYASNTPRARRHLESVSGPVVVPSTLRKRDDLVFSGTVSPIASEMYVFANGTSTQTQTASK